MAKKIEENLDSAENADRPVDTSADGVHVVLWTRRPVCGARADVVDRLSTLRAAGDIAEYTIRTWPGEVALTEHTDHAPVVEAYEDFQEWATAEEVSVTPPFERRTVTSLVGRTAEVLTVPVLCLAVYGDELRGVYPCSDGERTWTVTDFLDCYEAAEGTPVEPGQLSAFATEQ